MLILIACLLVAAAVPALADVPTVENPREAPAQRTLQVRELWRAGTDEDAEYVFGVVSSAVAGPDGSILLLDTQTQTIHAFDRDGRYLGETARKGEGPGEISMVYGLRPWDAEHLAGLQVFPARLRILRFDGLPGRSVDVDLGDSPGERGFASVSSFAFLDDGLVCSGHRSWFEGANRQEEFYLASLTAEGKSRHLFGAQPSGYDFSRTIVVNDEKDYIPFQRWALGPDGEVFIAPERNAYVIEVRDLDGVLLRRITRDVETHRRTKQEKERVKSDYSFSVAGGRMPEIRYEISDVHPPLHGLDWRDGLLWVRTARGWEDRFPSFDIYDREGNLLEERSYDLPLDREQDNINILPGGRIVRMANLHAAQMAASADLEVQRGEELQEGSDDEEAVLEIIVYEVVE